MVCKASRVLCTRGSTRLMNTTENRARAGITRKRSTSHCRLKKKGTCRATSTTVTVMANTRKDRKDTATDRIVQLVTLALYTDLALMEESSRVSRVPSSFSMTKAQELSTAEHTRGTHRNSSGHSRVVNTWAQAWR